MFEKKRKSLKIKELEKVTKSQTLVTVRLQKELSLLPKQNLTNLAGKVATKNWSQKVVTKVCYFVIYWFTHGYKIGHKRNMVANFSDEKKKKKKKEPRTEEDKREERREYSELILHLG